MTELRKNNKIVRGNFSFILTAMDELPSDSNRQSQHSHPGKQAQCNTKMKKED